MRTLRFLALFSAVAAVAGCRSRVVQITLVNASQQPLSTIVVDYPSATFGVNELDQGKTYHYPIKLQGTGPLKIQYADAAGHNHTYSGPTLHKNDEGAITVRLTQDSATGEDHLAPIR
jgi:hypothetical protein